MTTDKRIRLYLDKIPPCIADQGGDTHLFKVACVLYNGFALSEADTLRWLEHFNQKCLPPWDDYRLVYKAGQAASASHQKPRGYLLGGPSIAVTTPMPNHKRNETPVRSGKMFATATTPLTDLLQYKHTSPPSFLSCPFSGRGDVAIAIAQKMPSYPSHYQTKPVKSDGNDARLEVEPKIIPPVANLFDAWCMNTHLDECAHWQAYGQRYRRNFMPMPRVDDQPTLSEPDPEYAQSMAACKAWIASQLRVFFAEGDIPAKEDGAPDMDVATELAGWLKLSVEAYEARGTEAPDEEIRRTALACQFEHRGGRLPTMRAALGFLSVRLSALRPAESYVEGGDCGPVSGVKPIGNPANPSSASQDSTTQELIKCGVISGPDDPEAGFYASLVRTFGAEFTDNRDPTSQSTCEKNIP